MDGLRSETMAPTSIAHTWALRTLLAALLTVSALAVIAVAPAARGGPAVYAAALPSNVSQHQVLTARTPGVAGVINLAPTVRGVDRTSPMVRGWDGV